jgi:hypothetical protein
VPVSVHESLEHGPSLVDTGGQIFFRYVLVAEKPGDAQPRRQSIYAQLVDGIHVPLGGTHEAHFSVLSEVLCVLPPNAYAAV